MGWLNGVLLLFALLNIGGGIAGYMAKGSIPSVISGVGAGILLIAAATMSKSFPRQSFILAAVIAVATLGFFGTKYLKTSAVWPALVEVIAAIIVLICLAAAHFMNRPAKP